MCMLECAHETLARCVYKLNGMHENLSHISCSFLQSDMLKPGEPSGSAFLKVDPTYIQHWQQLFPQKTAGGPLENLRQRPNLISSTTPSSLPASSSAPSSVSGLGQLALFGQTDTSSGSAQNRELCSSSNCKNDRVSRVKLTSEELDFYLYGQQRMEIIHSGDLHNRLYISHFTQI